MPTSSPEEEGEEEEEEVAEEGAELSDVFRSRLAGWMEYLEATHACESDVGV